MKLIVIIFMCSLFSVSHEVNLEETAQFLINEIDPNNIANALRNLTSRPHLGGTEAEWENANMIAETWRKQGLDEVHLVPYDVLLSYPDWDRPNYVRILNDVGKEIWKSQGKTPPIKADEGSQPDVPPDFNAFSPPGNVTGDIVYVHFGREEDFDLLLSLGIEVDQKLIIARYGEIFRANIVDNAFKRGALGVLLYSDPQQYAPEGPSNVYPDTVFMPGSAAPSGTVMLFDGDPLTPHYPAIESAYRIPEEEAELPKIPVMPISYYDAEQILRKMEGKAVPHEWQGGLNFTYHLGPGLLNGESVHIEVNTRNQRSTTYNVVGVIKGTVEPDRYVLMGNHRDAWIFGALDPSSGTSAMMELTRALTEYKRNGWKPRRSLVFLSWGSEEYGVIASMEFAEQFSKQLSNRAVAYINVDMAIEGNYTLRTKSVPLLYTAAKEATKFIPNPNPDEVAAGRETVYDTWVFRMPDENVENQPQMLAIGSGSDYRGMQHSLGIPSLDYRYTHSKEMYAEPLYHTLYETYYLVSELYDRGFHYHAAIAQLWGTLGIYLSDSEILPLSVEEYGVYIVDSQNEIISNYGSLFQKWNVSLDYFLEAGLEFKNASMAFKNVIEKVDLTDPLAVRRINDQLMMVERAFIDPWGLPERPFINHVAVAVSQFDSYSGGSFVGITDPLYKFDEKSPEEQESNMRTSEEHIGACTHYIKTATKVLSDDLW